MLRVLTAFVSLFNLLLFKTASGWGPDNTTATSPPPPDEQGSGWDPWG